MFVVISLKRGNKGSHEELRASELQTTHVDLCTYTAAHAKTQAATSGGLGH